MFPFVFLKMTMNVAWELSVPQILHVQILLVVSSARAVKVLFSMAPSVKVELRT